jgi:hypothetical protein
MEHPRRNAAFDESCLNPAGVAFNPGNSMTFDAPGVCSNQDLRTIRCFFVGKTQGLKNKGTKPF